MQINAILEKLTEGKEYTSEETAKYRLSIENDFREKISQLKQLYWDMMQLKGKNRPYPEGGEYQKELFNAIDAQYAVYFELIQQTTPLDQYEAQMLCSLVETLDFEIFSLQSKVRQYKLNLPSTDEFIASCHADIKQAISDLEKAKEEHYKQYPFIYRHIYRLGAKALAFIYWHLYYSPCKIVRLLIKLLQKLKIK